ncbi:MAG TPA: exodeoxyribonuclease III [Rhodocyclaceae bacterium]
MLRIITLNLNGIRAAWRKGFHDWLAAQGASVVCLQELKARDADLSAEMRAAAGLSGHFLHAEQAGYSGVGLYLDRPPAALATGIDDAEFDAEGRVLRADFDDFSIVSLYLPSGSSSEERQAAKFRFMARFVTVMDEWRRSGREFIICGDWNIAHREIDLKNWKSNQKNSGFLPEERAWLSGVFEEQGWVDVYRQLHPEATDACYTWWSNRGQAWAKNVGWRLDYQIATPGIAACARTAEIYKAQRFSDHAPLIIDYDWPA